MLELGSGTGIVGIAAASMGAHVQLTDNAEAMPLLKLNVNSNEHLLHAGKGTMTCYALDWQHSSSFQAERHIDVVLGADLVYNAAAVPHAIGTINRVLGSADQIELLICHKHRSNVVDACMLTAFADRGIALTQIARGGGEDSNLSIYYHGRKDSLQ